MQVSVEFKNNKGQTLRGVLHLIRNTRKIRHQRPAVIYLHGFPGDATGPRIARFCRILSFLGHAVLRFNFSGTPPSDGKFEDKLMSQETKDIKYAIDFLEQQHGVSSVILVGHSTGAIDVALYAFRDKRVEKLVLLGGVSNLKEAVKYDFSDEQIKDFKRKRYIVYQNPEKWTYQKKLKRAFYDEFFKLNVLGSVKKFKRPILIIHGEKDEAIPVKKDPHELYAAANEPKQLVIIKGADHRFSKLRHALKVILVINKFVRGKITPL